MPLFSSHRNRTSPAVEPVSSPGSRGILSRSSRSPGHAEDRSSSTLSGSHNSYNNGGPRSNGSHAARRSRGLFGRRRSLSPDRRDDLAQDQTLLIARSKVADAEASERSADAALSAARMAVREARDHVKILEREALHEAKRAKMKQAEAKNVRKSARSLGRHG